MNIEIRLKSPGDNDGITRIGKTVALQLVEQAIEMMDDDNDYAIIWRDWGGLVRLEVADDSQPDPIPLEYFWQDGEWQRREPYLTRKMMKEALEKVGETNNTRNVAETSAKSK